MRPRSDTRFNISLPVLSIIVLVTVLIGLVAAVTVLHVRLRSVQARIEGPEADEERSEERTSGGDSEIFEATVEGIDELLRQRNAVEAQRTFEALTATQGPVSVVADTGLRVRLDGELRATLLRNGRRYFTVQGDDATGAVEIESRLDESVTVEEQTTEAREFVVSQREELGAIIADENEMRERLEGLENSRDIAELLESREMHMTDLVRDGFVLRRGIANEGGAVIVRLAADAQDSEYQVDGESLEEAGELEPAIAQAIRAYDPEEELRRAREELENRLSRMLEDAGFQAFLEERGLRVTEAEEDEDLVHRLETQDGETAGGFALEPESGAIELVDADRESSWTLDRLAVTHGLAAGDDEADEHPSFLLLGRHDDLTDAIMVVKPGDDEISVISVPRDIYVREQKLNELFAAEGPEAMMDTVSELTGLKLNHYVVVDMDGFAEVVDALGTIEVEFDTEFLDPTMHYRIDGERRMLYFAPGTHEVNGDGALALARSRKTSSDFSRSQRQRLLVGGIRRRVDQLALSDAGRLYDLLNVALDRSETDMGFTDALRYYRRYRDVDDIRHEVLSSNNVLYSTYEKLHEEGRAVEEAEEMSETDFGAWILRPRGDDWSIVEWYVDVWLSGGDPDVEAYLDRHTVSYVDLLLQTPELLEMLDQGTELDLRGLFELERELP
ncbi:MAG: LCP family protein [Spirochaetia bacterium]